MNYVTEPHQPHYRVEFCLQAPEADWEPSDNFLRFDNKDAALSCVKNPPTHIGDKFLNYNVVNLLHIDYECSDQDSWYIKDWIATKQNIHFDSV